MTTLTDKAQEFKTSRLKAIIAGRTWQPMRAGPVAIALFVPLQSATGKTSFDVGKIDLHVLRHEDWGGGRVVRILDVWLSTCQ